MKKNIGILFDLDGTLWETTDSVYQSLNEVAKKYDLNPIDRDKVMSGFGLNKYDYSKLFFPDFNEEERLNLLEEVDNKNINLLTNNGGYIYPGLEQVLFELNSKYDLYIVSNTNHKEYIEAFLISSKLWKYFKNYEAASEILVSKGEAILKVIENYELDMAIYVGDTFKDMEAANIAGIPFVQCLYGYGDNLNTKYYVNNVEELPEVIENILNL